MGRESVSVRWLVRGCGWRVVAVGARVLRSRVFFRFFRIRFFCSSSIVGRGRVIFGFLFIFFDSYVGKGGMCSG